MGCELIGCISLRSVLKLFDELCQILILNQSNKKTIPPVGVKILN